MPPQGNQQGQPSILQQTKKIVIEKFNGGLVDNWWYTQVAGLINRDDIFQDDPTKLAFGYSNVLIKDGVLYPELDTPTDVNQINQLNSNKRVIGFVSVPDTYVDSSNKRTIFFVQDTKFHAFKLNGFKIMSTSDTPNDFPIGLSGGYITAPHNAHSGHTFQDIALYQINGQPAVFMPFYDNTDADLICYYVNAHTMLTSDKFYGALLPDGSSNHSVLDKNFPTFLVPSDNTKMYIFNGQSCHSFNGNASKGVNGEVELEVFQIGDEKMFVDACEWNGMMYIAAKASSLSDPSLTTNLPNQRIEIYIWDRNAGSANDSIIIDASDIYNLFSDGNRVYAWIKGSGLRTELWVYGLMPDEKGVPHVRFNNTFTKVKTVGYSGNGIPANRRSITRYKDGIIWQDIYGKVYYFDSKNNALHILATTGQNVLGNSGALINYNGQALMFNRYSSGAERVSVIPLEGSADTSSVGNGGSNVGGVEFGWFELPKFSTLVGCTVYWKPKSSVGKTANSVNFYFTFKDTAPNELNRVIQTSDWNAGFKWFQLGKSYVNKYKFYVSFDTNATYSDLIEIYKIEFDYIPGTKRG